MSTTHITQFAFALISAVSLTSCGGGGDESDGSPPLREGVDEIRIFQDVSANLEWARVFELEIYEVPGSGGELIQLYDANPIDDLDTAKAKCEGLAVDGKDDWRVPTPNEAWVSRDFLFESGKKLQNYQTPNAIGSDRFPFILDEGLAQEGFKAAFWLDSRYESDKLRAFVYSQVEVLAGWKLCVRGTHLNTLNGDYGGTWESLELINRKIQTITLKQGIFGGNISEFNQDIMDYAGVVFKGHSPTETENAYSEITAKKFVRSGIKNTRLKGELKSFSNDTAPRAQSKTTSRRNGVAGIGDINLILGDASRYLFTAETIDNPAGTTELATDGSGKLIVYCTVGPDGRLILDDSSPVNVPSGEVEVAVEDHEGNQATFTVEVIGEETDIGVLNIPEATTEYNFKTSIDHGNEFIYFGYSNTETPISYNKTISICNLGLGDISGTTFVIEPDASDISLIRSFSHGYNGSATGFGAGECKSINLNMAFYRPVLDDEIRINVTINDNFNVLTWDDYTTFKLSQYEPLSVYFAADENAVFSGSSGLQGIFVAPGRQLLRINFTGFSSNSQIRVPSDSSKFYEVVLAANSINDEATYMLSSNQLPNLTLMDGFSNVAINEPDDTPSEATLIPLFGAEEVGYLHAGDVDFYRLSGSL